MLYDIHLDPVITDIHYNTETDNERQFKTSFIIFLTV